MKAKGTPLYGKVIDIYTKIDQVNWDKKFPTYIHVEFDDGSQRMAHHSQLTRAGNR